MWLYKSILPLAFATADVTYSPQLPIEAGLVIWASATALRGVRVEEMVVRSHQHPRDDRCVPDVPDIQLGVVRQE